MSKIAIYYFSGTANTECVVKLYRDELSKLGNQVDIFRMEEPRENQVDINVYDMIGFAYPVHAFSAPRLVFKFIERLPAGLNKPCFIFRVSGGYSTINNGSAIFVRENLVKKGYKVFHESALLMATNFIVKNSDEEIKKLYKVAQEKAVKFSKEIHEHTKRLEKVSEFNRLISHLADFEHFGGRMLGKFHYHTTADCILCGKCVQSCPAKNIYLKHECIRFGFECTLCMRCLYVCPVNAIKVRLFDFIKVKDGFNLKAILENDAIIDSFERNNEDSFYKKYKSYIEA